VKTARTAEFVQVELRKDEEVSVCFLHFSVLYH